MDFPDYETALEHKANVRETVLTLQLFLTAKCRSSPEEIISQDVLIERRIATIQTLNDATTELREIHKWLKQYQIERFRANRAKRAARRTELCDIYQIGLRRIARLDGNEEAVELAKDYLQRKPVDGETP